jgi:hypothetical protein
MHTEKNNENIKLTRLSLKAKCQFKFLEKKNRDFLLKLTNISIFIPIEFFNSLELYKKCISYLSQVY